MKRICLMVLLGSLAAGTAWSQTIDYHFNGMWYQPALAGHGFNLVIQPNGSGGQTVFLTFFTYDDSGTANFYAGNVDVESWTLGDALTVPMQQTAGAQFTDPRAIDFDDPDQFAAAGSVTLRVFGCGTGSVSYSLIERSGGEQVEADYALEKLIGVPIEECRSVLPSGSLERFARIDPLDRPDYRYFLYVPSGYDPATPAPLMVAWHGAAGPGQAEVQAEAIRDLWLETAEAEGFIVLAQTGTSPNGSWIPNNAALVLGILLDQLAGDYAIDPQRIYGWGFSAGGHTMHSIALDNTDLFAGYAVNAGALNAVVGRSALGDVPRRIPFSSLIGTSDSLLGEARGDRDAFLAEGWVEGETLFYREFDGGHTVTPELLAEHWANLRDHLLP